MSLKPFEQILDGIKGGSRAEHRRARGIEDESPQRELPPADDDLIVDAEVMDDGDELIAAIRRSARVNDDGEPMTPAEPERSSAATQHRDSVTTI